MKGLIKIKLLILLLVLVVFLSFAYADTECIAGDCSINVSINVVGLESFNETIEAIGYNVSRSVIIGGGNITVPVNIGYIDSPMIKTNVSINVKGIVGITGNTDINLTIGPNAAGSGFTPNPSEDVILDILIYINGTIDNDADFIDIYISVLKETIDNISPDAEDNMKVFAIHNNRENNTYSLIRQPDLDLTDYYLFKFQIESFSFFRVYYDKPGTSALITSTETEVVAVQDDGDGSCPPGHVLQNRKCVKIPEEEIPQGEEEEEEIDEKDTDIPKQLFDITWDLEDRVIESSSELNGIVIFEPFTATLTPIDLTFIILDENGEEIYREKSNIIIMTEEAMRWSYDGLDELPDGKYIAVLEILYDSDMFDEFRQEFEITKKESFFESITGAVISALEFNENRQGYAVITIVLVAGFIIWIIRRNKNS